jgi:protein-S-isoprenylcysteine O-methyltransferase Ste14
MAVSQLISTISDHIVLIILWLLYFFVHSLFASLQFKQLILQYYPRIMPWYRLIFNLLSILLLLPPVFVMFLLPGDVVWQWSGNWHYLANLLALLALAGFLWSLRSYDNAEFLGTRQLKESRVDITEEGSLKLSVLHRYVRHPWYALALVLIWTRDMNTSFLISAILISLYFIIGSRLEEGKLIAFHGDQYRMYRKFVAALIPLPWRVLSKEKAVEIQNYGKKNDTVKK